MALDQSRLGTAIHDKILSLMGATATNDAQLLAFANAIAQAVVTELTTNAIVLPGTMKDGNSLPVTGQGQVS